MGKTWVCLKATEPESVERERVGPGMQETPRVRSSLEQAAVQLDSEDERKEDGMSS